MVETVTLGLITYVWKCKDTCDAALVLYLVVLFLMWPEYTECNIF